MSMQLCIMQLIFLKMVVTFLYTETILPSCATISTYVNDLQLSHISFLMRNKTTTIYNCIYMYMRIYTFCSMHFLSSKHRGPAVYTPRMGPRGPMENACPPPRGTAPLASRGTQTIGTSRHRYQSSDSVSDDASPASTCSRQPKGLAVNCM